jgi:hypothetical protein
MNGTKYMRVAIEFIETYSTLILDISPKLFSADNDSIKHLENISRSRYNLRKIMVIVCVRSLTNIRQSMVVLL